MTAIFCRGNRMEKLSSDEQLQRLVLDALRFDIEVPENNIGVRVDQGIVTLTGTVECYVDKLSAQRAVHRVCGVLDVANELEVRYGPDRVEDDTNLAIRVRRALEADARIPHMSVQTTVSHGYVILEGTVPNFLTRDRVEQALRFVTGVRSLRNWIQVVNASPVF